MKKIKVLIVDDSEFIRKLFMQMLSSDDKLEVVGTACDPYDAREKIKSLNPDVMTLDIEMPNMHGLDFLEKVMQLRPMPVIMVSTLTQNGAECAIKALALGAVDCVGKPLNINDKEAFNAIKEELIEKVHCAAQAKLIGSRSLPHAKVIEFTPSALSQDKIIAIGSSTGGVEAIKHILPSLPKTCPPIVIVQHILSNFTGAFAASVDKISQLQVMEAVDNQRLESGKAYIAPGSVHLTVVKKNKSFYAKLIDAPKVTGHKPAVDMLFSSVAAQAGNTAIGVILTGMGHDGADGMLEMKNKGAFNIGQNADSCVVYGMPKSAHLKGAINIEVHLKDIAATILKHCK